VIVSHEHRFIFIHGHRTGGRSVTAALAKYCGRNDIITAVEGVPARNAAGFERHDGAAKIRRRVGEDAWQAYFKFTFERNPWDKILSHYWDYVGHGKRKRFYKTTYEKLFGQPLPFRTWFALRVWQGRLCRLGHIRFPRHFHRYTENGRVIVDFIGRFECRREHLQILGLRLGLPIDASVWIGSGTRKVRSPYTEHFDEKTNRIVHSVFREDLKLLGYAFAKPHPTNVIEPFTAMRAGA
jgi:hypothetical protein